MEYIYYCPFCGEDNFRTAKRCSKCFSPVGLTRSLHEVEYYENLSMEKYGDYSHIQEFLEPEIRANPLFDEEKFNHIPTEEEYAERRKAMNYKIPTYGDTERPQPNTPHCPTCGSTNLRKIGNLERGLSVTVWGFGSSKMGKQFECKDCGYKF